MRTPCKFLALAFAALICLLRPATAELGQLKIIYGAESASERAKELKGFLEMNVGAIEIAQRLDQ